jgi:SAM-dependent methyltransferase
MTNLNHLGEAAFDTIVCNNSLYYVPHRPGVRLALTNFFRLLRPGGHLIIYQANRWRSRDGLTKDPIVHLMPGWLAKIVCSYTGWRHSHGRVEFISPIDLRIRLRRAGFTQIRQTGNLRGKPLDGLRGMFADFFFTIATKR